MNTHRPIMIVMATFNGEAYLREQLDSLLAQSLPHWTLLARDDGSQDASVAILREYAGRDDRIRLLEDGLGNLGASASFSVLLSQAAAAGAGYVACCDQDDIWAPDKLAISHRRMLELETEHTSATPILVHTDLEIVDDRANTLDRSYMHYANIRRPADMPIEVLLVQSPVVGCTMLANRALLAAALPVPPQARMHDWWLALCARSTGILCFLPATPIKYRQHGRNTLGAGSFALAGHLFTSAWWAKLRKWTGIRGRVTRQAFALQSWLQKNDRLAGANAEGVRAARHIPCLEYGHLRGPLCAWRAGFRGQNWLATTLFYLFYLAPGKPPADT